jgi:hypothetical protein
MPTEVTIKVPSEDPEKKKDERKDEKDKSGSLNSKDNADKGEGEELVRQQFHVCM